MQFYTIGDLARRAEVPVHRVTYVIETRGIAPVGRAGQVRLFNAAAAEQVLAALNQIAAERSATRTSSSSERVATVLPSVGTDTISSPFPS